MKGIFKRGNIYWIRYAGIDGKIIRETSHSTRFKEAEKLLVDRKQTIGEGKMPEIKRIGNHLFDELADQYLKWAERQRGFKQKRLVVGQLRDRFHRYPLRRFDTRLVEQYQTERLQSGNKPGTANRHVTILKHMFNKAVDWDMVEEETLKRVRKAKLLEENNGRLRYLSKDECQVLLESCDPHLRPIVICALNTGMRKGEILGLKWDDVDLVHGFILLSMTKNGERREIPINGSLREVLEELSRGTKERPRRIDIPYVFYDARTGSKYGNVQKSFNSALKRAKIKDFRFHDLRHCFASHLVMLGIDLTTVKELLGHKTLTMTLRYAHLAPSHKVKAVDVLDRHMHNPVPTAQKLHNLETI